MEVPRRMVKPVCKCHAEPMYWHKRSDIRAGGLWRCAVRKRDVNRAWEMRRYDADPAYRIGKRLHDDARNRAKRLQRTKELISGPLSDQG